MDTKVITSSISILYYNFNVPAGFPSPADNDLEEPINLNKELIKHPLSTFLIQAKAPLCYCYASNEFSRRLLKKIIHQ